MQISLLEILKNPLACRGVAACKRKFVTLKLDHDVKLRRGGRATRAPLHRKTPPSLAVLVPPSCSQNAPVLTLKMHLTGWVAAGMVA